MIFLPVYDVVIVKEEPLLHELHDRTGPDQHTDKGLRLCKLTLRAGECV